MPEASPPHLSASRIALPQTSGRLSSLAAPSVLLIPFRMRNSNASEFFGDRKPADFALVSMDSDLKTIFSPKRLVSSGERAGGV
jgi:hypothetical protein